MMFYWLIQELGSKIYTHGPYKTEDGRDHRFDTVSGGELYKFNSFKDSPEEVRKEFLDERTKKLLGE